MQAKLMSPLFGDGQKVRVAAFRKIVDLHDTAAPQFGESIMFW
jgi:hypothetical protein